MPKIMDLIAKILNPKENKEVIISENHLFDLITPYEDDTTGKHFRPQLVSACNEVEGLDYFLSEKEREKVKEIKQRKNLVFA